MTKPYTGGCACGAIRYETSSEPIVENHCQCRDCQKRSGTGHGSYLTFPQRADVTITGEAKRWRVAGDSGNEKVHAFCPTCGTPVYLTFVAMPDLIAVHATSLDDPSQFNPQMVTYSIRGHAWDTIDSSLQKFERMPRGSTGSNTKLAVVTCCRITAPHRATMWHRPWIVLLLLVCSSDTGLHNVALSWLLPEVTLNTTPTDY